MDSQPTTPMDVTYLQAPSPDAGPMEVVNSPQSQGGCSSAGDEYGSPAGAVSGGALLGARLGSGAPVTTTIGGAGVTATAGGSTDVLDDSLGSPPVDDRSLHETLARNREKLKVKLLTRRPIHQLVQQGIIPPLKASPQFLEQKQRLERAKMGDFLKNKMQHRPDRDTLIRAHILEDTSTKLDPSLQEKQRRLKRARLKDDLNDRLAHRPGPLELIRGNILQADESFAQAIKEGTIPFKRTCEGDIVTPSVTDLISESNSDDSQPGSSEGGTAGGSRGGSPPQGGSPPPAIAGSATSALTVTASTGADTTTTAAAAATASASGSSVTPAVAVASRLETNAAVLGAGHGPPTTLVTLTAATVATGAGLSSDSNLHCQQHLAQQQHQQQHYPIIVCAQDGSTLDQKQQQRPQAVGVKAIPPPPPPPMPPTPLYFTLAPVAQPAVTVAAAASATSTTAPAIIKHVRSLPTPITMSTTLTSGSAVGSGPGLSSKKKSSSSSSASNKPTPSASAQQTNKNRIIKFHEYKGPPSATKDREFKDKKESSYELLLQQQKVFLQWQMDNGQTPASGSKQKMILPAPSSPHQTANSINSEAYKLKCAKLEDMKVSDLKIELKKRNLPVSGSKPQLIERLKPFSDEIASAAVKLEPISVPIDVLQLSNGGTSSSNNNNTNHSNNKTCSYTVTLSSENVGDSTSVFRSGDSVMAKMDILHKELLEKQRIQTLLQQQNSQQHTQTDVITITDGRGDQTIQVNRVLCQPGVQIIHAKPQLVTLQVAKSSSDALSVEVDPSGGAASAGGVLNVSGLTVPQNTAIVGQVAVSPSSAASAKAPASLAKSLAIPQQQQPIPIKHEQHVQLPTATQAAPASTVSTHIVAGGQLDKAIGRQLHSIDRRQNGQVVKQFNVRKQDAKVQQVEQPPTVFVASSAGSVPSLAIASAGSAPSDKDSVDEPKDGVNLDGGRSHMRTHSLPGDMVKLLKAPPEYDEATKQALHQRRSRESCEVNLNDIFEIITKQGEPTQFEVTRNPDTGVVTLKEATADTPKTSHIVTPDIKAPVVIEGLLSAIGVSAQNEHRRSEPHSALADDLIAANRQAASRVKVELAETIQNLQASSAEVNSKPLSPATAQDTPADKNGHNDSQSFKGIFSAVRETDSADSSVQLNHMETENLLLEENRVGTSTRMFQDEKVLDFNVDLDSLETLDINFDIIQQDHMNKNHLTHQDFQHESFKNLSLDNDQMSTDFQDIDWWSNELFQAQKPQQQQQQHHHHDHQQSTVDGLLEQCVSHRPCSSLTVAPIASTSDSDLSSTANRELNGIGASLTETSLQHASDVLPQSCVSNHNTITTATSSRTNSQSTSSATATTHNSNHSSDPLLSFSNSTNCGLFEDRLGQAFRDDESLLVASSRLCSSLSNRDSSSAGGSSINAIAFNNNTSGSSSNSNNNNIVSSHNCNNNVDSSARNNNNISNRANSSNNNINRSNSSSNNTLLDSSRASDNNTNDNNSSSSNNNNTDASGCANSHNFLMTSGLSQPASLGHHHTPAISLYSDMQGLLCDDVVMADWNSPQPHSFDIHMQM